MLRISTAYAVVLCLSVRLSVRSSVRYVHVFETNKYVFYTERGSPVGVLTGTPPKGGIECKGMKNLDFRQIYLFISEMIRYYIVIITMEGE